MHQMSKESASHIAVEYIRQQKNTDKIDVAVIEEQSDGWMVRGPRKIQRWEPLRASKRKTRASRPSEAKSSPTESDPSFFRLTRYINHPTRPARISQIICRFRK